MNYWQPRPTRLGLRVVVALVSNHLRPAELEVPDDGNGGAAIGGVGGGGTPAMQRPDVRWRAGNVIWHWSPVGPSVLVDQGERPQGFLASPHL